MSQNENSIPRGRMLSDSTLNTYAEEIIGVLQMWGFSRTDAYRCVVIMKGTLSAWPKDKPWDTPLRGTPFKADQAVEGGLLRQEGPGNFSFGELGKKPN